MAPPGQTKMVLGSSVWICFAAGATHACIERVRPCLVTCFAAGATHVWFDALGLEIVYSERGLPRAAGSVLDLAYLVLHGAVAGLPGLTMQALCCLASRRQHMDLRHVKGWQQTGGPTWMVCKGFLMDPMAAAPAPAPAEEASPMLPAQHKSLLAPACNTVACRSPASQ